MATEYGQGFTEPGAMFPAPAVFAEGRVRAITATIAVANNDAALSKHYVGKIPSSAIIDPSSLVHSSGITSVNDYDIGLELNGVVKSADVLANGIDVSGAGTDSVVAAVAVADLGKRVYELLGLANDPGVMYDIVGLTKAQAGGDGTLHFNIKYKIQ